ncbi:MAG: PepSY domain-containing protein [Planctomycetota bacterium]
MIALRVVLAGLLLCLVATAQDDPLAGDVGFDIVEAIEKGLKVAGGGDVFHAELEPDRTGLAYSIDIDMGEKSVNIVLNAKTGEVLENVGETADLSKVIAASKIDLKKAIEVARKLRKGRIVDAQLGTKGGRPAIAVKALFEGLIDKVYIDAVTGEPFEPPKKQSTPTEKPAKKEPRKYTDRFSVDKSELGPTGRSPYFILEPGYCLVLEGMEGDTKIQLIITILDETKVVDGVTTRVLEERESEDGELVEISRNFVAISNRTTDVYYFGEEVDMYKDGKVVSHEGEWLSGEDGAVFGLLMPANPLLGSKYYQEVAPGAAMDRAKIESLTDTVKTPAGTFEDCVRVRETTPLEPGVKEYKWHRKGIGLIQDAGLKLVRYGKK